jgi:chromosome segregation ATPase
MTDYMQKAQDMCRDLDADLDVDRAVYHLARTLKALDTERAAYEATKEAIKRQAAAVRTLQASEQSEINILRKERHKAHEAIKTLESERAANALLTDELEATKAELQAMREALRYYDHQFCELGESHECCGRLSKDECSGCFARQTLTRKTRS